MQIERTPEKPSKNSESIRYNTCLQGMEIKYFHT